MRGQKVLEPEQRAFSKAVFRIRQPIEALLSWIDRITSIQNAGLVRATSGLLTYNFWKICCRYVTQIDPVSDF